MKKLENITDKNIIHITIGNELKGRLIENAREKGLSLNAYIRMILNDFVKAKDEK